MITFLRFMYVAFKAYNGVRKTNKAYYTALLYNGVPCVAMYVALDREAWRISRIAIEEGWPCAK